MMNGIYILVIIPFLLYCSVMIIQYYTSLITAWNLSFISFTYVKHLWLEFTSCNFSVLSFYCKEKPNINTEWRKKKIILHYCSLSSIELGDVFEVQTCQWQSRAPHQGTLYIKCVPRASDWKPTLTTSCKDWMQISPQPNHSLSGQEGGKLPYIRSYEQSDLRGRRVPSQSQQLLHILFSHRVHHQMKSPTSSPCTCSMYKTTVCRHLLRTTP